MSMYYFSRWGELKTTGQRGNQILYFMTYVTLHRGGNMKIIAVVCIQGPV